MSLPAVSVVVCVALALAHAPALVAPVEFALVITVVVTAIAAADISFFSYMFLILNTFFISTIYLYDAFNVAGLIPF